MCTYLVLIGQKDNHVVWTAMSIFYSVKMNTHFVGVFLSYTVTDLKLNKIRSEKCMANILVLQLLWRLHFWSVIKSVLLITNKIKSKPFGFYSLYCHYIQKFPYSINFYVVFLLSRFGVR